MIAQLLEQVLNALFLVALYGLAGLGAALCVVLAVAAVCPPRRARRGMLL